MKCRFFLLLLFILLCAGLHPVAAAASEPIPVFVSIPPQKYFVEKIGETPLFKFIKTTVEKN